METYHLKVAGLERDLPVCPLGNGVSIAGFVMFSDVELTIACATELLKKVPDCDVFLTAESKGIPLAYEMSRQSGKRYILARKSKKLYMKNAVEVDVRSITTAGMQKLYLSGDDMAYLKGKRVLLCAGDTFRAAAADQLEIWAGRAQCELIRQHEGADPSAVLFDALQAAKARHVDVVICDTAGRLHNKSHLMAELAKMKRVIDRELPEAALETLLVLDATTGQNGLIQAKQFQETTGLTGIVLTKLDGTAKGGIVIAIAQALQVPVKFVGLGEGIDDLQPFDAKSYVEALI